MIVKDLLGNSLDLFNSLLEKQFEERVFEIDCATLPKKEEGEVVDRTDSAFNGLFEFSDEIKKSPCVYRFQFVDPKDAEKIVDHLPSIRKENKDVFKMAPVNVGIARELLYVGIRQPGYIAKHKYTKVSSRILAHFGYHDNAGVKIIHWYNQSLKEKLGLTLKLKVIVTVLPEEAEHYLEVIEKMISLDTPPMMGRH